jgi:hypothetical protein
MNINPYNNSNITYPFSSPKADDVTTTGYNVKTIYVNNHK